MIEDTKTLDVAISEVRALPGEQVLRKQLSLLGRPSLVDLELTSQCNARCGFCPRDALERRLGLMSEETFGRTLDFLRPGCFVMLCGLGEPLLHPRLIPWLHLLDGANLPYCLVTNGILLEPALQRQLFGTRLRELQISLHEPSGRGFSEVMVGANRTLVHENLEWLSGHRPAELAVRLNCVADKESSETRAVQALAHELGFAFQFRRIHSRAGLVPGKREVPPQPLHWSCGTFSSVLFLAWSGDVLPCSNDVLASAPLGRVGIHSLDAVMEMKRVRVRQEVGFEICKSCDDDYRECNLLCGPLDDNKGAMV